MANFGPGSDDIGWGAWLVIALYLLSTLAFGFVAFIRGRRNSTETARAAKSRGGDGDGDPGVLQQHFLAGRGLGRVLLTMSQLASAFSGFTLVGIPAEAYRRGFFALRWMPVIVFVVFVAVIVSPRIVLLTRKRGYLSPSDFFADRYRSFVLHKLVSLTFLVSLSIFTVAQFSAMGTTVEGLSNGRISSLVGAAALSVLLLLYEAMGGLTAVALTDTLQGFLLLLGFGLMLVFIQQRGGVTPVVEAQKAVLARVPGPEENAMFALFATAGLGSVLRPEHMSRTMASKNQRATRTALIVLGIAPFVCSLPAVLLGVTARDLLGGNLGEDESSAVFSLFVKRVMLGGPGWYLGGALLLAASIAAIMSTADSGLIVLSLLISADFVRPLLRPSERTLKIISTAISVCFAGLSILLSELPGVSLEALWGLQQEMIIQAMPAFVFGMYTTWARAGPITLGLCAGLGVTAVMAAWKGWREGPGALASLTPGYWGLALNVLTVGISHLLLSGVERCRGRGADERTAVWERSKIQGGNEAENEKEGEIQTGAGGTAGECQKTGEKELDDSDVDFDPLARHSSGSVYGTSLVGDHLPSSLVGLRVEAQGMEPSNFPAVTLPLLAVLLLCSGLFFSSAEQGDVAPLVGGLPDFAFFFLILLSVGSLGTIALSLFLWDVSDKGGDTHSQTLTESAGGGPVADHEDCTERRWSDQSGNERGAEASAEESQSVEGAGSGGKGPDKEEVGKDQPGATGPVCVRNGDSLSD
uniref:Sodium/solute symporter n=1 Tax=Chromera velia CCMP2878 TaxID=1169474 RepID=A0A0G4IAJ3_9ALVE|eukprot:Cvel_2126.t1-p1 / transcript=Cvel_2126.t1 / gene=Cvel_2126 / organism=Chromera_velia_CCMP2878 / gene_product=Sodium/proline symporter, putative / transcript_product=Sodium/proline symporter, putative / location=Cvel_scaffold82:55036-57447(+) / protein_length=755 / sequence_SO=supercontig / SO=protein_coding / is_pseudo=false